MAVMVVAKSVRIGRILEESGLQPSKEEKRSAEGVMTKPQGQWGNLYVCEAECPTHWTWPSFCPHKATRGTCLAAPMEGASIAASAREMSDPEYGQAIAAKYRKLMGERR